MKQGLPKYRCFAITKKGERCRNRAQTGTECYIHSNKPKRLDFAPRDQKWVRTLTAAASLVLLAEKAIQYLPDLFKSITGLGATETQDSGGAHKKYEKELFFILDSISSQTDFAALSEDLRKFPEFSSKELSNSFLVLTRIIQQKPDAP